MKVNKYQRKSTQLKHKLSPLHSNLIFIKLKLFNFEIDQIILYIYRVHKLYSTTKDLSDQNTTRTEIQTYKDIWMFENTFSTNVLSWIWLFFYSSLFCYICDSINSYGILLMLMYKHTRPSNYKHSASTFACFCNI